MKSIIKVENLGKKYRIGRGAPSYSTLREMFAGTFRAAFTRRRPESNGTNGTIWALRGVDIEIEPGEVVGIIGRNGAGKSTLLKILSRIVEPTEGRAELYGRVGSLLEVGTGFHPELTGRENIYLYGAILGMKKAEIDRRFDEIVSFAEIEKFMNTPVKRYSSGMYVRLAFAVAAHLEPDILIVDEVLAVGDAAFQKKCLGKMQGVTRQGRTVLFVSHNMTAIRNLCTRAIWLHGGRVLESGDTASVTEAYLRQSARAESLADLAAVIRSVPPDAAFRLEAIEIRQGGQPTEVVINSEPTEIRIRYRVLQRTSGLRVYFDLLDDDQNILIRTHHDDAALSIPVTEPGTYLSTALIPAQLLAPRAYELRIHAGIFNVRSCIPDGIGIRLVAEASSQINRAYPHDTIRSKLQPLIPWVTEQLDLR